MKPLAIVFRALAAVVCLLAVSCALRQPPLAIESYAFDLPKDKPGPAGGRSIAVLPFNASSEASGQMFLYRSGEMIYEHDFYNRFLVPPAQMLTSELRGWLLRSRVGSVREPGAPLSSDLVVQPRLTELYADYRDVLHPRAVAKMVITVVVREASGNRELFERNYGRAVMMSEVSPAAAARGWNSAVASIFGEFTRDLRGAR
jgi:cholesterol transport system auxiliary component